MQYVRPSLVRLICGTTLVCTAAAAHAQPFVGWRQVTERVPAVPGGTVGGSLNQDIAVSSDGTKVAFVAAFDYTGENTNGSQEIFVYDGVADTITQITSREGPLGGTALFTPQWTPDGTKIIFRAGWNFPTDPPSGTNSSIQVWEVDVNTRAFRRITDLNAIVNEVRLSADGSKVTFYSAANPLGTNAAGRNELFIVDRATLAIQQLTTHIGGFPNAPRPSGDGSVVVFDSAMNFDGTNTNGSIELWKVNPLTGVITAVSDNTGGGTPAFQVSGAASKSTALDASGRWAASAGSWNPFGTNSAVNLFLYDLSTSPVSVSQITTGTGNFFGPIFSADGRYLALESQRSVLGSASNPDGNRELFIYDRAANNFANVTNSTGGASLTQLSSAATVNFVSFSHDGRWIAYRSDNSLEQGVTNVGGNFELYYGFISDTAAPQIGRGPVAAVTLDPGATLNLRVHAAGRGVLNYEWQRNGQPLADGPSVGGGTISGANTPRLTIAGVAEADEAVYTCRVSNADGSTLSSGSALTVNPLPPGCGTADFDNDGDSGTDSDIEAFFACLAGNCCPACQSADFDGDGDTGTDSDIEAFFRVLAGGNC